MPELIDHYFLVDRRDAAFVNQFLDHYTIRIEEKDLLSTLSFYEQHPDKDQIIYLNNPDIGIITHVILAYTDDAKLILGISAIGTICDLIANKQLHSDIQSFLHPTISCMTVEDPPPGNSIEFIAFAKQRSGIEHT